MKEIEYILTSHLGAQNYPINKIHKTCCTGSPLRVIDYDEVVKVFCQKLANSGTLSSADCLYVGHAADFLCFIEMKNISMHLKTTAKKNKDVINAKFSQTISTWLEELHFCLQEKLTDSIYVLTAAAGMYGIGTNALEKLIDRQKTTIKYAIVAYMTSADYLAYALSSLNIRAVKHKLLDEPKHTSYLITNDAEFSKFVTEHLC
jgi:hypothetical protein